MAVFDPISKKFYCECGCGQEINFWASWVRGHNMRPVQARERFAKVMSRANSSLIHDEDWNRHSRESHLQAYVDDPTLVERISKSQTGMLHDKKTCRQRSRIATELWKDPEYRRSNLGSSGAIHSEEAIENMRKAHQEFLDSKEGRKYLEGRCGEGNPNWKGGHYRGYGYGWGAIRDFILARDNDTCQGCGSQLDPVVHHIDSDISNVDEYNLITVCQDCNCKAASRYQKSYWFEFYSKKIEAIYQLSCVREKNQ